MFQRAVGVLFQYYYSSGLLAPMSTALCRWRTAGPLVTTVSPLHTAFDHDQILLFGQ